MRLGIGLGLNAPRGGGLPGIGGAATGTLADLTLSAAGKIIIAGVMAVTLGDMTGTGAAQAVVSGVESGMLDVLTVSATGTVKVQGSASPTLDALTSSAAGTVQVQGAAAATLDAVTSSATGAVIVQGASSPTLGTLMLASAGTVKAQGALAATLDAVALSATGTVSGGAPSEAWVQPDFNASTGVTLGHETGLTDPAIAAGSITFVANQSTYAYATSLVTIVAGTWRVTVNVTNNAGGEDPFNVIVGAASFGDQNALFAAFDPTLHESFFQDIVITGGDIMGQLISIYDPNGAGPVLTSLSVTKIA